jgi:hypothetical protein
VFGIQITRFKCETFYGKPQKRRTKTLLGFLSTFLTFETPRSEGKLRPTLRRIWSCASFYFRYPTLPTLHSLNCISASLPHPKHANCFNPVLMTFFRSLINFQKIFFSSFDHTPKKSLKIFFSFIFF